MALATEVKGAIAFGPFQLFPTERLLEKQGAAITLGGRALDILIMLTERPGDIFEKRALMDRVWPGVTVDEGSLRFHIASLRKTLGEGQDGARYILNVAGRGYSFVAPTHRDAPQQAIVGQEPASTHTLPAALARMVGRQSAIETISGLLSDHRIVSIVGAGGIGKTTTAVAVGHHLLERYRGAVHFVDLSALGDADQVPTAVAATLGLLVQASDVVPSLIAFLAERPTLLILDNCEHVIETTARFAERLFEQSPSTAILTTSREALRIEGERAYGLSALETPPEGLELTAELVMEYPAAALFIERIASTGGGFTLTDAQAPVIGDICRKLDGMALAIELAAGRVDAYGLIGVADLLDSRIRLLWRGRRTAPPRHHTLTATLDWSYNLLSDAERRVLDRLSVFAGGCDLMAAQAVVADDDLDAASVLEAIAGLIAKSLVSSQAGANGVRYYLLQTTRAYVRAKAEANEDFGELSLRHAQYFTDFLSRRLSAPTDTRGAFAVYGEHLANLRSALGWALSPSGDRHLAVGLAAAGAGVLAKLALLSECESWCRRALDALDAETSGSESEMELQTAYGQCLMFTRGNGEDVQAALARGLELAVHWNAPYRELQILGTLNTLQTRLCRFVLAVETARRSEVVARQIGDPAAMAMADFMLGVSLHGAGDQAGAEKYCEAAIGATPGSARLEALHLGYDHRLRALMSLARCLWMRGDAARGLALLGDAMAEADALGDTVTINIVMMYTAPVLIWMEDWERAEGLIARQIAHADKHGLGPYKAVGIGLSGELAVKRGKLDLGIPLLQSALEQLRAERHHWWLASFLSVLAEGLVQQGRQGPARGAMEEALAQWRRDGETWFTPELLRTAAVLANVQDSDPAASEALLEQAIDVARRQCALAWELRATMDLALLLRRQGRLEEAKAALLPPYEGFNRSLSTPDFIASGELLKTLG